MLYGNIALFGVLTDLPEPYMLRWSSAAPNSVILPHNILDSGSFVIWYPIPPFNTYCILWKCRNEKDERSGGSLSRRMTTHPGDTKVETKERMYPETAFAKKINTIVTYVENSRLQIFWVTLYSLVCIGIFIERAYCEYINIYCLLPKVRVSQSLYWVTTQENLL